MSLLITDAYAATSGAAAAQHSSDPMSTMLLLVGVAFFMYFLLWRPQSKRVKEHRELVTNLNVGDEIVTNGGLLGEITKLNDDFIVLTIAAGVTITLQRQAVANALPKGTLEKSI